MCIWCFLQDPPSSSFSAVNICLLNEYSDLSDDRFDMGSCGLPSPQIFETVVTEGGSTGGGRRLKNCRGVRGGVEIEKDEKVCAVCGDKAIGCNFDAISCESCKAFFRRNALKQSVSSCYLCKAFFRRNALKQSVSSCYLCKAFFRRNALKQSVSSCYLCKAFFRHNALSRVWVVVIYARLSLDVMRWSRVGVCYLCKAFFRRNTLEAECE